MRTPRASVLADTTVEGKPTAEYQFYRIFTDAQGSVNAVTNDAVSAPEFDAFDAWGKRRWPSGDDDKPGQLLTANAETTLGYTGEEELDVVGLVHLNARLYDPVIGRFLTRDPAGLAGGQNPYGYTGNNPLSRTDVTGRTYSNDACTQTLCCVVFCYTADCSKDFFEVANPAPAASNGSYGQPQGGSNSASQQGGAPIGGWAPSPTASWGWGNYGMGAPDGIAQAIEQVVPSLLRGLLGVP